jgi:hypothetical protein
MGRIKCALGSDSTMSGAPTFLHECRAALETGWLTAPELLEMATRTAAQVFQLPDGCGTLEEGAPADIILLPEKGSEANGILSRVTPGDIALVLVGGKPRLANAGTAASLGLGEPTIRIEGAPKWVYGDLPELRRQIEALVGDVILSKNPLWRLVETLK